MVFYVNLFMEVCKIKEGSLRLEEVAMKRVFGTWRKLLGLGENVVYIVDTLG